MTRGVRKSQATVAVLIAQTRNGWRSARIHPPSPQSPPQRLLVRERRRAVDSGRKFRSNCMVGNDRHLESVNQCTSQSTAVSELEVTAVGQVELCRFQL